MCPACGYVESAEPPYDERGSGLHEICPCCGFQFGVTDDDAGHTFEHWRAAWIAEGLRFRHTDPGSVRGRGERWDPLMQLRTLREVRSPFWPRRPRRLAVPARTVQRGPGLELVLIERVQLHPGERVEIVARAVGRRENRGIGLYIAHGPAQALRETRGARGASECRTHRQRERV
jgi:hypothetical protein